MADINLDILEPRVSDALQKAELTKCHRLADIPDHELLKLGNITLKDIKIIKKAIAGEITKKTFTKVSRLIDNPDDRWTKLSTGCSNINNLLRGGISRRGITELSGESGSGKTQFCLQLTIMVQLSTDFGGLNAGAVYICTEDKFPSPRLQQLFSTFPMSKQADKNRLGDNVFIEHIADVDGLKQCVSSRLPILLRQQNIGLIVVDSITAVFRVEYSPQDLITRAKDLRSVGLQLHSLAKQFKVCVLCVNQVSAVIRDEKSSTSQAVPALGLSWANLVTTRLQMFRTESGQRFLQVIFAPDLHKGHCPYNITTNGISGDTPTHDKRIL